MAKKFDNFASVFVNISDLPDSEAETLTNYCKVNNLPKADKISVWKQTNSDGYCGIKLMSEIKFNMKNEDLALGKPLKGSKSSGHENLNPIKDSKLINLLFSKLGTPVTISPHKRTPTKKNGERKESINRTPTKRRDDTVSGNPASADKSKSYRVVRSRSRSREGDKVVSEMDQVPAGDDSFPAPVCYD